MRAPVYSKHIELGFGAFKEFVVTIHTESREHATTGTLALEIEIYQNKNNPCNQNPVWLHRSKLHHLSMVGAGNSGMNVGVLRDKCVKHIWNANYSGAVVFIPLRYHWT